jgi:hypothetical protein
MLLAASMPSLCFAKNCVDVAHKKDIDLYLQLIYGCINDASKKFIPIKRVKANAFTVAGWNDIVSDKHDAARQAFLDWVFVGKPRFGHTYEIMKRSRAQFKLALRFCKNNEEMLQNNLLASNVVADKSKFWKNVKNISNCKVSKSASTINGASSDDSVAAMWKDTYEKLYSLHDNKTIDELDCCETDNDHVISNMDLCNAIQQLKCRKSCGPDGIPAEALKHSGHVLSVHLTLLFNMCLCHCYLPNELTKTTVVPLLKNKSGDISDINNYRAIALSNCLSKLLESLMLRCFQSHDSCDDIYQFGFKKNHSTSLGCAVLKSVVDYYRSNGSYVFASFLDLSKAFDNVNHKCLFKKLSVLKLPRNMFKLLIYWYSNQQINVRWKQVTTSSFYMKNGTRQGSLLSPYLFSVYMRDVTDCVVNSRLGCHVGGMPACIILYADDIVVLAPTWSAQQKLLNLCFDAVNCLGMTFNADKSVTMIFVPFKISSRVSYTFPSFMLCGCVLNTVESYKYLGHIISPVSDDKDITRQMSLLYARTNILLRKFGKCSRDVKLCLFRAHCIQFYGAGLWCRFSATVMKRFEAAYVKCIKMFFNFARLDSVTAMFYELGLPTFKTLLHNAKFGIVNSIKLHANVLIQYVRDICSES